MSLSEWVVSKLDKQFAVNISKEWGVPFLLAVLLSTRGFKEKSDADGFLYGYDTFSNPFDFTDMDKLANRVKTAIDNHEKICVYGDYDADGVTATSLVYSYLKSLNADVMYYIPTREGDGYGLNKNAVDMFNQNGVRLIFTVDNGVSAFEEVKYAKELGIDIVITDHHRVPKKLPDAVAIVNPYREDCPSKFKKFSGVGVAFKAICAIDLGHQGIENLLSEYSDLVAIGTIGDSIELVGETRDLVRVGVSFISQTKREGIKGLLEIAGLYGKNLDSMNVAFGIVPRINASGRMGNAERALKMLLGNEKESSELCLEINNENILRKDIEAKIMSDIENSLECNPEKKFQKIIIAEGEGWHFGVLGIVASRITKKYGKPSMLITSEGEYAKGSCRSIEGFSIHEAITKCSKYLDRFGGHPMAAGINLKSQNLSDFRNAILQYASSISDMPFMKLNIECKLNPKMLSLNMVEQIEQLKPFGVGNPEPIFGLYSMRITKIRAISGGKHLRLTFRFEGSGVTAMYFNKTADSFLYKTGDEVDLAVTLHKNQYGGADSLSIFIVDIKLSSVDTKYELEQKRIYERFMRGDDISLQETDSLLPDRDDFIRVYNYLKNSSLLTYRCDIIGTCIGKDSFPTAKVYVILDVMKELGLADISVNADEYTISIRRTSDKIDLYSSKILSRLLDKRREKGGDL